MAYYPASLMPPPDHLDPFPVDRKAALAMAERLERPADTLNRRRTGGAAPLHNRPPAATGRKSARGKPVKSPYASNR